MSEQENEKIYFGASLVVHGHNSRPRSCFWAARHLLKSTNIRILSVGRTACVSSNSDSARAMTARLLVLSQISYIKFLRRCTESKLFGFLFLRFPINSEHSSVAAYSMQERTQASSFQSEPLPKSTTKKPRARLTASDVIDIFSRKQSSIQATTMANMYGVSEKAIRDIWTARTWARETWHLEPSRILVLKQAGRPRGSTDSRPRQKKRSILLRKELPIIKAYYPPSADQCGPPADAVLGVLDMGVCFSPAPTIDQQRDGGDTEGSWQQSLDEQLDSWDSGVCVPDNSDPFKGDWEMAQSSLRRPI